LSKAGTTNIIEEYINFCRIFDEQVRLYGQTQKAVKETLRLCKNKRILKNYLNERAKEVQDIMVSLFDQKEATKRYGYERYLEGERNGIKNGISQGISQGRNEASEDIALNLLKGKMDANSVAKFTKLPLSRIHELSKTI